MTIPVNRQFVGDAMIHQKLRRKEMTYEQAIEQLKELLDLTMPPTKSEKLVYRVPFRTDYLILNQITLCYKRDDKVIEAVEIYQQIMIRIIVLILVLVIPIIALSNQISYDWYGED